jgi:uncharacterized protein (DUF2141 family)
MKLKNSLMIIAMLTFGASAAQHTLRLTITGVGSSEGKISAALYTDQKTFLKFDAVFKAVSEKAEKGVTNLVVKDIPEPGTLNPKWNSPDQQLPNVFSIFSSLRWWSHRSLR